MNWDALGAVAELAGAIGVILTLVYLARQINQNTSSVRSSAASAYSQVNQSLTSILGQDAETSRVFFAGLQEPDTLTEAEGRQSDALISMLLQAHEQAHDLIVTGALPAEKWTARQEQIRWLVNQPGFARYWERYSAQYEGSFGHIVDESRKGT